MIAYPLAGIFKAKPELEEQVEKAKKFQEMPTEEMIKQLLEILAGKFGGNGHE